MDAAFSGEKVYRELVPEDFARPSNEIECVGFSAAQTDADAVTAEVQMLIRTFVAVDAYHNSQFSALYRRAMTILGLFARGYLNVSDSDTGEQRAPKVTASAVPVTGKDFAEVHLTFSMQLSKADFDPPEHLPTMEHLTMSLAPVPAPSGAGTGTTE